MVIFYFIISSTFINYKEELSLLHHLFVYSIICLHELAPMDIFFILWLIINCYHYLFYSWNCSRFGYGNPLKLASVSFWCDSIICWVLSYFLALQDILDSSCTFPDLALESTFSPRTCGSLCWRMVLRNKNLGAKDAHWFWSVFSFFFKVIIIF